MSGTLTTMQKDFLEWVPKQASRKGHLGRAARAYIGGQIDPKTPLGRGLLEDLIPVWEAERAGLASGHLTKRLDETYSDRDELVRTLKAVGKDRRKLDEKRAALDVQERETVLKARAAGLPWQAIAEGLGITRQSAWEKYGKVAK